MNRDTEKAVLALLAQTAMAVGRIADAQASNARQMEQMAKKALEFLEEQRAANAAFVAEHAGPIETKSFGGNPS